MTSKSAVDRYRGTVAPSGTLPVSTSLWLKARYCYVWNIGANWRKPVRLMKSVARDYTLYV